MRALVVVDVQADFVTGSLAVPDAAAIVPVINRLRGAFDLTIFTKDWHPPDHSSFARWPVHCVQGEPGADFAEGLDTAGAAVFPKGSDPASDSYSGFADDNGRPTGLERFLKEQGVAEVAVCGLATDYCVKATALDAARLGFRVSVIADAVRGVNREPGDAERALEEMARAGVRIVTSAEADSRKTQEHVN